MTEHSESYPNADTGRWIVDISRDGSHLALDDGSRWKVAPTQQTTSQNWHRTLVLRATRVQGLTYDLRSEADQSVLASFLGFESMPERARPPRNAREDVASETEPAIRAAPDPGEPRA